MTIFKKTKYFLLLNLLAGCALLQVGSQSKNIRNEACMESPRLKVLQVLDNGILAHLCPTRYPSFYEDAFAACAVKGDLVYMSVAKKENNYVDDQKLILTQTQCFVGNGTYSYTRNDGHKATVRNIEILEEESNPADEAK